MSAPDWRFKEERADMSWSALSMPVDALLKGEDPLVVILLSVEFSFTPIGGRPGLVTRIDISGSGDPFLDRGEPNMDP